MNLRVHWGRHRSEIRPKDPRTNITATSVNGIAEMYGKAQSENSASSESYIQRSQYVDLEAVLSESTQTGKQACLVELWPSTLSLNSGAIKTCC